MEKKTSKARAFLKKNVYYIIMAVCLLAIAAMITLTVLINNGVIGKQDNINEQQDVTPTNTNEEPLPATNNEVPVENPPIEQKPDVIVDPEPVPTAIVFASPVQSANVGTPYVMDSLVWNASLKHYAVHNGIDFCGNDGDNVYAVYDGTVADVSYDVLNGHTVTIRHSDTLSTVYKSLNEPVVGVGQFVRKGGVIGTMGTTATSEYSMGAHVHFTVLENGIEVDPNVYMTMSEQK